MGMRLKIALHGRDCSTQSRPIFAVAGFSKRAEKLMRMGLQDRGTAPHDFPSLASSVARCAQGTQTSLWIWPICRLRQCALAGRLACPIHIEDKEVISLPVPQPSWLLLCHQRTSQQIFETQGAQGLDCALVQRGEKARERRTGQQTIASEQGHESTIPGLEALVKAFQRSFSADRIAEEHGDKIDHFLAPKAPTA